MSTKHPSLAIGRPELLREWHPTRNLPLTPERVTLGSNKSIWWQCQHGHKWEASVCNRTGSKGKGCPYCSGRRPIMGQTDLATTHPHLLEQWHPTQNLPLTPHDFSQGSDRKATWICKKGHVWNAAPSVRIKGIGCPFCAGKYPIVGETDLATTHPELVREWHPTQNLPLTPQAVTAGRKKTITWQCRKGHVWDAVIYSRTGGKASGCPYCSGLLPILGQTDLSTTHPHLRLQWHPTKNQTRRPDHYSAGSGKKVWWLCERGHEWEATIASRANGIQCPHCNPIQATSFREQALFYYVSQYFPNATNRHRLSIGNRRYEVDVYLPDLPLALEYDGAYWHQAKNQSDQAKKHALEAHLPVLYLRESPLPCYADTPCWTVTDDNQFEHVLCEVLEWIKTHYSLPTPLPFASQPLPPSLTRDRLAILESFRTNELKQSLAIVFPHLKDEWHPTKNGRLRPEHFKPKSGIKVWWLCDQGHSWEARIADRSRGTGCPICRRKQAFIGKSSPKNSDEGIKHLES